MINFWLPFKEPLRRKLWSEKLKQDLQEGQKVCELHFDDKFIKKHDEIRLPDGKIFVHMREHFELHLDAVPITISDSAIVNYIFLVFRYLIAE